MLDQEGEAIQLAEKFEIDENAIRSLLSSNSDWAFILQANALVETALNSVLSRMIVVNGGSAAQNSELRKPIEQLTLLGRASKVSFAKAAGLFDERKEIEKFINQLANIRNCYAHDLKNVDVGLYEMMYNKEACRNAFCLKSDWAALKNNPSQLRKEIRETLFKHLDYIYLFS